MPDTRLGLGLKLLAEGKACVGQLSQVKRVGLLFQRTKRFRLPPDGFGQRRFLFFQPDHILLRRFDLCLDLLHARSVILLKYVHGECFLEAQFLDFLAQLGKPCFQFLAFPNAEKAQAIPLCLQCLPLVRFLSDPAVERAVILIPASGLCRELRHLFFPPADMQQTVAEDNDVLANGFHCGCKGGNTRLQRCPDLLDRRFQIADKGIVGADLTVHFAALGEKACRLKLSCADSFMDRGLFVQTACGVAAVVDAGLMAGTFQPAVAGIGPGCPPCRKLFYAVPSGGDGILPPVFGALRVFGCPLQPLRFGCGGCHEHLLFPYLVRVLLLPALRLRRLVFGGGEALFLTPRFHLDAAL